MTFQGQQHQEEDRFQEAEELVDNGIELTSESEGEDQPLGEVGQGPQPLTQSEVLRRELPDHIVDRKAGPDHLNTDSYLCLPPDQHATQNNNNEVETDCPFSEHNFYKDTNLFQYTNSNQKRQNYENLEEFEKELEELTQPKAQAAREVNGGTNDPSHSVQQSTGPDSLVHPTSSQDNSNVVVNEYNKYILQKQQMQPS